MLDFLIKTADARLNLDQDRVKNLGRRAAQRYIDSDDKNLTSAVSSVLREEGDLTRQQIRRVTEAANQATWNSLFVEGGDAGTTFDPADISEVLQEVAPPTPEIHQRNDDYDLPPPPKDIDPLLSAFDAGENVEQPDRLDPTADIRTVQEKVSHARGAAASLMDTAYMGMVRDADQVYDLIKQAYLQGEDFYNICKSVGHACIDQAFAQDILSSASARLISEGNKVSMTKSAGEVVINEDHPLISAVASLEKNAQEYLRFSDAKENLGDQNRKLLGALRDKLREV